MTKLPTSLTPYARKDDDEATTAARGLEAHFLRQMLAEVRNSSEGSMLDGGFAGSTFKEMLDGALADKMAPVSHTHPSTGVAGPAAGSSVAHRLHTLACRHDQRKRRDRGRVHRGHAPVL